MAVSATAQTNADLRVRSLQAEDDDRWRELYAGYAAFYGFTQTEEQAERTSTWLMDPAHELEGLVAHGVERHLVGLAHVRAFVPPSTETGGGYLDDGRRAAARARWRVGRNECR
jgi:hypothetical protein